MTESMDAEDYSFYLAYGTTQEEEQLESLIESHLLEEIAYGDTTSD